MSDKKVTDIVSWAKNLGETKAEAHKFFTILKKVAEESVNKHIDSGTIQLNDKRFDIAFQKKIAVLSSMEVIAPLMAKEKSELFSVEFLEELKDLILQERVIIVFANGYNYGKRLR